MTWSTDWASDWATPVVTQTEAPEEWQPAEIVVRTEAEAQTERDAAAGAAAGAETGTDAQRADHEALLQGAYAEGYDDGAREAERAARERLDGAVRALESAIAAWTAGAAERDATARDNLNALGVGIARHIIGRELKGDAHAVAELVRRALSHFSIEEPIRIRLNPEDLSAISTAKDGAVRTATGRKVEWQADAALTSGDCVVEGDRRVVDGRVDLALERVYAELSNG